ncbi:Dolichyl-diphosphooligosaccharide--protein glycosyltransferase subunit WBP1 [Cokeromyces recurvatus]|uniref:Dolichyl-diphosphooligosaccharide--protein glycosyltransferase subunit WBP1 n=1 Tax=Cokeromyces recurvatus TaxID=90255 RepID=UPI002220076A|nr:Dolichyl-diphosphooligosaccharide--protein glycosyltransferase subunit WBP1 [Cokeromyces recurvatus]KAI7900438.1 Dolichyl-diphosphooligosaccharide--protein glycosyltransferase subunit WBP1 [Cokeromyces recurvatus]
MRSIHSFTALFITALTLLTFVFVEAKSVSGNRILVLLDSLAEKDVYSRFWQQLEDRQYELTFKSADDTSTALIYFNEPLYNHIIHFAPKASKLSQHSALNNVQLVNFVNNGGNMLIAAGAEASDNLRALASEFDIELGYETVFDHDNYYEEHDKIITSNFVAPSSIIDTKQIEAPILYSGTGLTIGQLPLSSAILTAESNAFLADSYHKKASSVEPIALVGALQARNSARVTFVGSLDIFSNEYLSAQIDSKSSKSGNEEFIKQLSQWTFQEKGVLKIVGHHHHKEGETEQRDWYRVKDDIVYNVDIVEYKNNQWVPYKADDIQLEVIMLDPYIRTTLKQVPSDSSNVGRFEANIRLPDVYGVFTLKVNYKRTGVSYILAEDQVSIRPFRHNEYPRFLTAAYPYYASTGSMILGFLVFSAVWLATWGGNNLQKTSDDNKKVKSN